MFSIITIIVAELVILAVLCVRIHNENKMYVPAKTHVNPAIIFARACGHIGMTKWLGKSAKFNGIDTIEFGGTSYKFVNDNGFISVIDDFGDIQVSCPSVPQFDETLSLLDNEAIASARALIGR